MGQDAIDLVIRSLVDRAYLPNDFIFSEGDLGDDMYFIRTGEVSLIKTSHEYSRLSTMDFTDEMVRLKPGAYFGELAALMGGARRKLTAVSHGYSILSLLSADAFRILEQDHPVPFVKLVRNAQNMLKTQQQPSCSWDQIMRMVAGRGMSIEHTFEWIQAGKGVVDHISIASFTDAMRKLGVDRFSAHALWIEADLENDGFLTYEEFEKSMRKAQDKMNDIANKECKPEEAKTVSSSMSQAAEDGQNSSLQTLYRFLLPVLASSSWKPFDDFNGYFRYGRIDFDDQRDHLGRGRGTSGSGSNNRVRDKHLSIRRGGGLRSASFHKRCASFHKRRDDARS